VKFEWIFFNIFNNIFLFDLLKLILDLIYFLFHSSKRTVDFGLSRGYSGAQEAKHRMAMQIANFAGGPGRKRRSGNKNQGLII
jgi:hypothetical protein